MTSRSDLQAMGEALGAFIVEIKTQIAALRSALEAEDADAAAAAEAAIDDAIAKIDKTVSDIALAAINPAVDPRDQGTVIPQGKEPAPFHIVPPLGHP
jgi:hypothetical protein